MLAQARRQLAIPLVQGRAEALPFADGSVDFVSIGYTLRHVANLSDPFVEFLGVLKPGGRLLILEVGQPENRIGYAMLRSYLGRVVPTLSRRLGREYAGTLMRSYWDTTEACVPPSVIMNALEKVGAVDVNCRREFAIFHAYVARRGAGRSGMAFMV
jgi:demethylmenaquinone methyltransferase / 2-methoxy-6-polyprenyl-1,4-benzoquinol methylase